MMQHVYILLTLVFHSSCWLSQIKVQSIQSKFPFLCVPDDSCAPDYLEHISASEKVLFQAYVAHN